MVRCDDVLRHVHRAHRRSSTTHLRVEKVSSPFTVHPPYPNTAPFHNDHVSIFILTYHTSPLDLNDHFAIAIEFISND